MKKLYCLAAVIGLSQLADAQVLNQPAGWPNAAWTITGTYNSDPLAFEADPTVTANFAYDDDDAGNSSHEDNIAAESPVIDLTAAYNANEKKIQITAEYGYYYLADDVLQFEYWDAGMSMWMPWPGGTIPGNNTNVTNNYCTIPKTTYISSVLDLANFTPAMLEGFKYRLSYNDSATGADWNYGFCFGSPTLKSVGCEAPSELEASNVTPTTALIEWASISGIEGFEYVLNTSADEPASGTSTTEVQMAFDQLMASTVYYFHIRTNCGDSFSEWRKVQFTTLALPPSNDSCGTATAIESLPYTNSQDATAATNNAGFISACSGMNDGVWYSFTGDGGDITVTVNNVVGWDPELGIFTGSCGTFTCVGQRDNAASGGNETYTITASVVGTTYYVNVGHYSGSTNSAEGPFSITVNSNVMGESTFDNAGFSVYPNPVKNIMNLSYSAEISDVTVYNLLGQNVMAEKVNANQTQLDLSSLTPGAYLVKVVSGNASKTIKIVKQ